MAADVAVSFADLHRSDGVAGRGLLVSVLGIVYDVGDEKGRQFFAPPDGSYRVMAGHDATYMLAQMSLKADDADKFGVPYDADDRQTLAEWIAYFDASYCRVGWLVDQLAVGVVWRGGRGRGKKSGCARACANLRQVAF